MNVLSSPILWLEAALAIAMTGALGVVVVRDPVRAWRMGLVLVGLVLGCTLASGFLFAFASDATLSGEGSLQERLLGELSFSLDELNAPLLPLLSLVHFLTVLSTGGTKIRRFSLGLSLLSLAIRLAALSARQPGLLIGLLVLEVLPGFVELRNRGRPMRLFLLHMVLFTGLLCLGWSLRDPTQVAHTQPVWAIFPLQAAILLRCGVFPLHCWLADWMAQVSFGNGLLFVTPLIGFHAALRLVLPAAPEWLLSAACLASLATGLYGAGMAVIQQEARRFFTYLVLSHASLALVGLGLNSAQGLTAALALWISASLSLTGLGLTLRALEARFGRLSLVDFRGLYDQAPALAICFLLTGLACVGFPGTLGFVASELLVGSAVESGFFIGIIVVLTIAIKGIAIVRFYLLLFAGPRHASSVPLRISLRERFAVLTLAALILGGGLFPQQGILSRSRSAQEVMERRAQANRL